MDILGDLSFPSHWKWWRRAFRRLNTNPTRSQLDFTTSAVVHKRGLLLLAADLRRLAIERETTGGGYIIAYQDMRLHDPGLSKGEFEWQRKRLLAQAETQWFRASILLDIAEKFEELADSYPDFSREWKALALRTAEPD